ncbi:MAG: hypothetical protein HGA85_07325, partial [Nanoarchaeota archaeon]|nr:hypothetical protein [Nanoarchaeota archaeon]
HFIVFLYRHMVVFPLITFVWFLVIAGFMLFIAKSRDTAQILLMSMVVIAVSRMTAYYNEDLSKDVAKLIPLTLLALFIVDPAYFSLDATLAKFAAMPSSIHLVLQYLIFIVLLELILKMVSFLFPTMDDIKPSKN